MIVPIVSKKSLSMIENVTRTAVTTPSFATRPKSRRPNVERSGGCTIAAGIRAAPGVGKPFQSATAPFRMIATSVVSTIPSRSAPRTRRAISHAVRTKPTRNTRMGRPRMDPSATGSGPDGGFTTKPEVKKPMNAMNRPIPTPIARLSPIGTASITASRNRVSTSSVMATPSRNTTVIAWGHVSPRAATSSNATTALSPIPGARTSG